MKRLIKPLILCACVLWGGHSWALEMTVILPAGQSWPAHYQTWAEQHTDRLAVHTLVRVDELEQTLSQSLSADPAQAHDPAIQAVKANETQFINAWRQALLIHRFKLDQVPAIIIDQRAVYYGINPQQALSAYRAWQP